MVSPEMRAVTFNDNQNRHTETFQMPVGTKITITHNVYEVRQDGVYQLTEKEVPKRKFFNFGQTKTVTESSIMNKNEVNVILPQIKAASLFDFNNDGNINRDDIAEMTKKVEQGVDYGARLNDTLTRSGSKYRVHACGMGYIGVYGDDNSFGAVFENKPWYEDDVEMRAISIEFPEQ